MEQKRRKISVRKVLQVFVTLIVTTGCVMAILSASKMQDTRTVKNVQMTIRNEKSCAFLDKAQLQDMLISSRHIDLAHTPIVKLNLHAMEQILKSNPWVANAEVYVDNAGTLLVFVTQSVPVLRVFQQDASSYYLDKNLRTLPLSDKYTHYAPVITNVPVLKDNDSTSTSIKGQLFNIVNVISADTFWAAQVSEINMTSDRRFVLIPVLGNHKVVIGDTTMLRVKLDNVFAFYKEVLNRVGWDKYQLIDASFKGQVVAAPALKWHIPKDRALSNMDWVKTVMGPTPPESIGADTTVAVQPAIVMPVPKPVIQAPVATPKVVATPAATVPAPPKAMVDKPKTSVIAKPADNKPKAETQAKAADDRPKQTEKKAGVNDKQTTNKNVAPKKGTESAPKPKYLYGGH